MIRMIAACTPNGVIGVDGKIPFDYSADMKQFKRLTLNSTVIMGRKTFEGIGKPLPKRRNIVISKLANGLGLLNEQAIEVYHSVDEALNYVNKNNEDIWFIGGAAIYQEGMKHAEEIHLTITPDEVHDKNAIKFPWVDPTVFKLDSWEHFVDEPVLKYCIYKRI